MKLIDYDPVLVALLRTCLETDDYLSEAADPLPEALRGPLLRQLDDAVVEQPCACNGENDCKSVWLRATPQGKEFRTRYIVRGELSIRYDETGTLFRIERLVWPDDQYADLRAYARGKDGWAEVPIAPG